MRRIVARPITEKQKVESRKGKAESRKQKAESRKRKAESGKREMKTLRTSHLSPLTSVGKQWEALPTSVAIPFTPIRRLPQARAAWPARRTMNTPTGCGSCRCTAFLATRGSVTRQKGHG